MAETFKVVRQHLGDRMYMPGEQREAEPSDVAHLVRSGALAKMDEAPENKAEPAPQNKAGRKAGKRS